jgi:hypothetical protein
VYGDAAVIRTLAARLRRLAEEIRTDATHLDDLAETTPWNGLAAEAMRAAARAHVADLRVCAGLHDDAADALERHAHEVDRVKDVIAAAEHRILGLVDAASRGGRGLLSQVVPDPLERWAAGFAAPARGSIDWLDVHVPDLL